MNYKKKIVQKFIVEKYLIVIFISSVNKILFLNNEKFLFQLFNLRNIVCLKTKFLLFILNISNLVSKVT